MDLEFVSRSSTDPSETARSKFNPSVVTAQIRAQKTPLPRHRLQQQTATGSLVFSLNQIKAKLARKPLYQVRGGSQLAPRKTVVSRLNKQGQILRSAFTQCVYCAAQDELQLLFGLEEYAEVRTLPQPGPHE